MATVKIDNVPDPVRLRAVASNALISGQASLAFPVKDVLAMADGIANLIGFVYTSSAMNEELNPIFRGVTRAARETLDATRAGDIARVQEALDVLIAATTKAEEFLVKVDRVGQPKQAPASDLTN